MDDLCRRDFLKLSALVSAGAISSLILAPDSSPVPQPQKPNIIILVFDAMSARDLSLYGYGRHTTPNLDRLAARATVFHSHLSAGNFTTSGTASMLLGLQPWTHRAINLGGLVTSHLTGRNLFHYLKDEYVCQAFSQNYYANVLLGQFQNDLDYRLPANSFAFQSDQPLLERFFPNDPVPTFYALEKFGFTADGLPSAPLFELIYRSSPRGQNSLGGTTSAYPYGIPDNSISRFENPTVYDGVFHQIIDLYKLGKPYIGYFHLFSPHEPYSPRKQFVDIFPDIALPDKPPHRLSTLDYKKKTIKGRRQQYDEYIADVDHEIGRLVDNLQDSGALDNSYLFLTSDHGELFERGEYGHVTRFLYEGVIHIPLLVVAPGQRVRRDIYSATSHVDLAPTILTLAGKVVPSGMEGALLPGLGGTEDGERALFCLEAKESSAFSALPRATVSMTKGDYKLIYYTGYHKVPDSFELYNLRQDPEEMQDLSGKETSLGSRMQDELLQTFKERRALKHEL